MSYEFFDSEPEDAWHPDDPIRELLANLLVRCALLGEPSQLRTDATDRERIAEIYDRLDALRRRRDEFDDLQLVKVSLIAEDVEFVALRMVDSG